MQASLSRNPATGRGRRVCRVIPDPGSRGPGVLRPGTPALPEHRRTAARRAAAATSPASAPGSAHACLHYATGGGVGARPPRRPPAGPGAAGPSFTPGQAAPAPRPARRADGKGPRGEGTAANDCETSAGSGEDAAPAGGGRVLAGTSLAAGLRSRQARARRGPRPRRPPSSAPGARRPAARARACGPGRGDPAPAAGPSRPLPAGTGHRPPAQRHGWGRAQARPRRIFGGPARGRGARPCVSASTSRPS
jgi:hypothetical protein